MTFITRDLPLLIITCIKKINNNIIKELKMIKILRNTKRKLTMAKEDMCLLDRDLLPKILLLINKLVAISIKDEDDR